MTLTPLTRRKAAPGRPLWQGRPGSPESLAQGMLPKGFPMNPGELATSARESGKADAKGNRRCPLTDGGAVLRPRSTDEGGEPQGSVKSGHGTHWREGGNRCTYLAKGNIDEAQTSSHYVHTNRQNIRTSQGGSESALLFDRSSDHARGVVREEFLVEWE